MAYFDRTCDDCGLGLPSELAVVERSGSISCPFCSSRVPDTAPETARHRLPLEVGGEEL